MINLKRVYEATSPEDGRRILVERLWPRGLTKEAAKIDLWLKDLSPSTELRKWFDHEPERWSEFKKRFYKEIRGQTESLDIIRERAREGQVTLVFGSREEMINNAVALRAFLEGPGQK